jgi:hypothetical protein
MKRKIASTDSGGSKATTYKAGMGGRTVRSRVDGRSEVGRRGVGRRVSITWERDVQSMM